MENTIVTLFVILTLLVGFVGGYVISPTETKTVYEEKIVEVPVNVSVEKLVEIPAPDLLSLAVDAFMNAVDDDEVNNSNVDVLSDYTNGSYDFDEVEVSRIYEDYSVVYEDDTTTVNFKIKLRFDEEDARSEKRTFAVTVIFEEEEDTEVEAILV